MVERIFNFSAGPAALPLPVLEKAQEDLLSYQGCGMSVMEMSHRSPEFSDIIAKAEDGVRKNLGVSDDYAVLFLQGGASLQFAMLPMNLYIDGKPIDVLHTGSWTKKAIAEMKNLADYRTVADMSSDNFLRLPQVDNLPMNKDASYVYMCSNNTIFGTQFKQFPQTGDIPLVADMSSDIFSREIDTSKFGVIFAGAQKNIGPSGVTLVIIRKDLAERAKETLPTMMQYRTHIKAGSLYNTPSTFAIYIVSLVMDWIKDQGGLKILEKTNADKAQILYDAIDQNDFFYCPVEEKDRSPMNVVFRITGDREELEAEFVKEAKAAKLSGLKGHRSVGGLRASIYNAHPLEGIKSLVSFMEEFAKKNG